MGGKLFKLPRMPRADYLLREQAMRAYLDRKLDSSYRIPRFYGDKPDFGDLDIIIPARRDWDRVRLEIAADLGVTQTKAVGRVFSMVFDGLQTDLFAVPAQLVESTCNYMSFNDLGNLLGRICRRFNLKYGEEGLSYTYRRVGNDHYRADLPITQDFQRICAFLHLDHGAWETGFATLNDVYDWVIASPYFSVAPYLDDLDGTMERRIGKRPGISSFIDFLRARGIDARPAFADRMSYLPQIIAAFPEAGLAERIAVERAKEERAGQFAAKFSGKLVMRLRPELEGKALAQFIIAFKHAAADFEAFLLEATAEEIERRIRTFPAPAAAKPDDISQ
jgi:hypothetical protein